MQQTLRYFDSGPPYVELTRRQANAGQLKLGPFDNANPPDELLSYFLGALEANPEFTWASYSSADGTYVAAHRTEDSIEGAWRTVGPAGTVMRTLTHAGHGRWRTLSQTDGSYDPRERPWYRAGRDSNEGTWVEPFVFATVGHPGFMYVRAQPGTDGGAGGVWAVEYEMSELSRFLSHLEVGEHGRVYVVTDAGEVVGHPAGNTTVERDGRLEIASATEHQDGMLAAAWDELGANEGSSASFANSTYLGIRHRFPAATGIPWSVVVAAPEADFFGEVHTQAWTGLGIGVIAALLAIGLGAFFSTRVSGALRVIADDLVRIGKFELHHDISEASSFVREVNDMRDTTMKMKRSLRSFGKYVPQDVVRDLIVSGEEAVLGGRNRELTVLFSDIAGFTNFAEKMSPNELVEILGEYLQGMSQAIRGEQGTVDKFIGDAVMAFWGAPKDVPDHAKAACRGALAMQARLAELQLGWDERGLPKLATRIGLNTGNVLVGNIGAPTRMNYTVMGDAVNLASRLEALNKQYGTTIMLGEATAELVAEDFVLRPLEWVAVKGKEQAVLIHELLGEEVDVTTEGAIQVYREALHRYRNRDFREAARLFGVADEAFGGDAPSQLLKERCETYSLSAPPEGWDGRYVMTTK